MGIDEDKTPKRAEVGPTDDGAVDQTLLDSAGKERRQESSRIYFFIRLLWLATHSHLPS